MRLHGKSIRRSMVALLIVPLASLTTIWFFTTLFTGKEAARLFEVAPVVDKLAYPAVDAAEAVQEERRVSLVYLGDPRAEGAHARLRQAQRMADKKLRRLRDHADDPGLREDIGQLSRNRLDSAITAFSGLTSLRRGVDDGSVTRSAAFDTYDGALEPCFDFLSTLHDVDDVDLDRQGRALTGLARARDALSREDALLAGALASGNMSERDMRTFTSLAAQRDLLYRTSLTQLPQAESDRYTAYWKGDRTAPLRTLEEKAAGAGPRLAPRAVSPKVWSAATAGVLADTRRMDRAATERYRDRVDPQAHRVLTKAAVAGVVGLLALVVSVLVPIRIGRRLVRELGALRRHAEHAADVQLPALQRRLATGEDVDAAAEVPQPPHGEGEIGAVGHAVGTLQRAAVEGAVRQAKLRRDVNEVFVNLARRNQALLHRQLKLLDTMERRTRDSRELADLFRLDHLTTRLRRHAEGLVILSGSVPSRQWRRPVPLLDVVRGAIGEVEDYERIEVVALPRTAVVGPAVAGLIHLLAELLENAAAFSPPGSPVDVAGETGHGGGVVLRVIDQGLGMGPQSLLEANLRLAETPEFELTGTERLGLFVVSRLASRLGLRVSLHSSARRGITAEVYVPGTLLQEQVAPSPQGRPPVPEPRRQSLPRQPRGPQPAVALRSESLPAAHGHTLDSAPRPVPASAAVAERPAAPVAPGGRAPLPRRQPRRGGDGQVRAAQVRLSGNAEQDAHDARSRMTALQSGWRRGRSDVAEEEQGPGAAGGTAGDTARGHGDEHGTGDDGGTREDTAREDTAREDTAREDTAREDTARDPGDHQAARDPGGAHTEEVHISEDLYGTQEGDGR